MRRGGVLPMQGSAEEIHPHKGEDDDEIDPDEADYDDLG
jgi:hypothetical protein